LHRLTIAGELGNQERERGGIREPVSGKGERAREKERVFLLSEQNQFVCRGCFSARGRDFVMAE
jgi:hypothetical protein